MDEYRHGYLLVIGYTEQTKPGAEHVNKEYVANELYLCLFMSDGRGKPGLLGTLLMDAELRLMHNTYVHACTNAKQVDAIHESIG